MTQTLMEQTLREIQGLKQEIEIKENKVAELQQQLKMPDILLYEDKIIKVTITFHLLYGMKLYVENQEGSNHDYYKLFGSHSWFFEWVNKLFDYTQLLSFDSFVKRFDFILKKSNYTEIAGKITAFHDTMVEIVKERKDECVNFFEYISKEIASKA